MWQSSALPTGLVGARRGRALLFGGTFRMHYCLSFGIRKADLVSCPSHQLASSRQVALNVFEPLAIRPYNVYNAAFRL